MFTDGPANAQDWAVLIFSLRSGRRFPIETWRLPAPHQSSAARAGEECRPDCGGRDSQADAIFLILGCGLFAAFAGFALFLRKVWCWSIGSGPPACWR